jgi:hypothetical protein
VLDIDYDELKQEKHDLAQREREMELSALRLLQHHPWRHATRLFFAALGFKIQAAETEAVEEIQEEPVTA